MDGLTETTQDLLDIGYTMDEIYEMGDFQKFEMVMPVSNAITLASDVSNTLQTIDAHVWIPLCQMSWFDTDFYGTSYIWFMGAVCKHGRALFPWAIFFNKSVVLL